MTIKINKNQPKDVKDSGAVAKGDAAARVEDKPVKEDKQPTRK